MYAEESAQALLAQPADNKASLEGYGSFVLRKSTPGELQQFATLCLERILSSAQLIAVAFQL